jgi:hypothetical protein
MQQQPAQPQTIQVADMAAIGLMVIQINDHHRAAAAIASQLYNEIERRQAFINSLPKSEAEKPA